MWDTSGERPIPHLNPKDDQHVQNIANLHKVTIVRRLGDTVTEFNPENREPNNIHAHVIGALVTLQKARWWIKPNEIAEFMTQNYRIKKSKSEVLDALRFICSQQQQGKKINATGTTVKLEFRIIADCTWFHITVPEKQ